MSDDRRWSVGEVGQRKKQDQLGCPLASLSLEKVDWYGGKAVVLGQLLQQGFSIPPGYALSTEACALFLAHNQISISPTEYLAKNDQIRELILNSDFPRELRATLQMIYKQLMEQIPGGLLVVRSSAPYEDRQSHSMAGVFDSYIQLTTYQELELAVKKCYASLFSDQALVLLTKLTEQSRQSRQSEQIGKRQIKVANVAADDLRMPVLIQQFVTGAPSGVIFTADPIALDGRRMIINAVQSICADFVDGTAPAAYYIVEKNSGTTLEFQLEYGAPLLTKDQIFQLHQVALEIEQVLGSYQDIEWTWHNGEVVILQARPITTFQQKNYLEPGEGESVTWGTPNLTDSQETWTLGDTNPLQPLVEDILLLRVQDGKRRGAAITGKNEVRYQICNGYPYWSMQSKNQARREEFLQELATLTEAGGNIFQERVLPQILEYRGRLDRYLNAKQLTSSTEAFKFLELALEYAIRAEEFHWLVVDGHLYLKEFELHCQEQGFDLTADDLYDLVFQISWLAKEREQVIQMASYVKERPDLLNLFQKHIYDQILLAHLKNHPDGQELLQQMELYLRDFGLFPVQGQWNLTGKLLREEPEGVLRKIRACLKVDLESYRRNTQQIWENKQSLIESLVRELDDQEVEEFHIKLQAAEQSFLVNDDHCYYLDMTGLSYLRLALIQIGQNLVEEGLIEQTEDIFFLHLEEVRSILASSGVKLHQVVAERKLRYEQQKRLNPPQFIGKIPEDTATPVSATQKTVLKGVSGLGKRVRGKVKVLKNNSDCSELTLADERILVLQHGHACYFLPFVHQIKGLIYDQGSPFDHPGILARELEIPSLYQTQVATEILQDGDEVELDGVKGQVVKLSKDDELVK